MFHLKAKNSTFAATASALGLALGAAPALAMTLGTADGVTPRPKLDASVAQALTKCEQVADSCGAAIKSAAGVLVFPNVVTVDLGVGGSGGSGALVENGKIVGYYDIGKASAGFQVGAKTSSQVYVVRDPSTLKDLTGSGSWSVGSSADLTVADANTTATGNSDPLVYVFNGNGLNAGVNVNTLKIWKDKGES